MKHVIQFVNEVVDELSKIVWPGFDELVGAVIIVVILVIAFSLYLGAVDFIFYRLAQNMF